MSANNLQIIDAIQGPGDMRTNRITGVYEDLSLLCEGCGERFVMPRGALQFTSDVMLAFNKAHENCRRIGLAANLDA